MDGWCGGLLRVANASGLGRTYQVGLGLWSFGGGDI